MSVMIGEGTEYSTEGSISQKVCSKKCCRPHRNEYNRHDMSSERKANAD